MLGSNTPSGSETWVNALQSWSEGLNEAEGRKVNDSSVKTRGQSVPFSPKLFLSNRVTPLPTTDEQSDTDKQSTLQDGDVVERPTLASSVDTKGDTGLPESQSISSKVELWSQGEQGAVDVADSASNGVGGEELSIEAILSPPKSSGEHEAYIPMDMAKECITRVIEDMKKMKANHYQVVEQIQEQYKMIEEESQV